MGNVRRLIIMVTGYTDSRVIQPIVLKMGLFTKDLISMLIQSILTMLLEMEDVLQYLNVRNCARSILPLPARILHTTPSPRLAI